MGANGSKRTKEKSDVMEIDGLNLPKAHESPLKDEPTQIHRHDERQTSSDHRHNRLQNPSDNRPIELSWLQQNRTNDHHNRTHHHHHHHHRHHDEHHARVPIAINRWPKTNDQLKDQKSKTFIEEYIHQ